MVAVTVSAKGRAPISLDFPGKQLSDVTVADVKAGVTRRYPYVRPAAPTN